MFFLYLNLHNFLYFILHYTYFFVYQGLYKLVATINIIMNNQHNQPCYNLNCTVCYPLSKFDRVLSIAEIFALHADENIKKHNNEKKIKKNILCLANARKNRSKTHMLEDINLACELAMLRESASDAEHNKELRFAQMNAEHKKASKDIDAEQELGKDIKAEQELGNIINEHSTNLVDQLKLIFKASEPKLEPKPKSQNIQNNFPKYSTSKALIASNEADIAFAEFIEDHEKARIAKEIDEIDVKPNDNHCVICLNNFYEVDPLLGFCKPVPHICIQCARKWKKINVDKKCPACKIPIFKPRLFNINKINPEPHSMSTRSRCNCIDCILLNINKL